MKQYFSGFLAFLIFLVQPEDSTSMSPENKEEYPGKRLDLVGSIKAIFWIVIAVVFSLAVAKL